MTGDARTIVKTARRWIGTSYRHQASACQAGCDCLGLLLGVWRDLYGEITLDLPPYSGHWRDQTHATSLNEIARQYLVPSDNVLPVMGDIVLFNMRRNMAAKHCGILSDGGHFIHAQERLGVVEVPMGIWWRRRIAGQFNFAERA